MPEKAGFCSDLLGKPIIREKVELQLNHTNLIGLLQLKSYKREGFADNDFELIEQGN